MKICKFNVNLILLEFVRTRKKDADNKIQTLHTQIDTLESTAKWVIDSIEKHI